MGSSQSKQSNKDGKRNDRSKSTSPNQEKHNSADSNAPLTSHAGYSIPRSPPPTQQTAIGANDLPNANADDPQSNQPVATIEIDEQEGHSNITRPPPPPQLRRLSELIDPHELTIDSHVRSPSGNLLAVEQFLVHPDRPRSMRERQEQIRERVRATSRLGPEVEGAGEANTHLQTEEGGKGKGKVRWVLCGCFGGS